MNKRFALLLILILTASSLIVVKPAYSSIPKPSVPEFTVKFVNASYSVTTTNPYTGVNETQQIINNSIEVKIQNQPFDYSNNGLVYHIYFNIRTKPHFSDNWKEVYPLRNLTSSYNGDGTFSYAEYISPDSPTQSNSSYSIIIFPVVATDLYSASGYDIQRYYSGGEGQEGRYFAFLSAIPSGGQVDFQVEALVGHDSQVWVIEHPLYPEYGGYYDPAIAYDTTSGWSNIQTLTIDTTPPTISIISPENKTYTANNVSLNFTVSEATSWIGYSLDGQANVTIKGNTNLTGLSEGTHNLTVYADNVAGDVGSSTTVHFSVDTSPPSVVVLSPKNKTYRTNNVSLAFTVNESTSWIGYSLDEQENVTLTENTTLTGLSNGIHRLTVYAKDIAGNTGASKTIIFRITDPFPTTLIVATTMIVTIFVVGATLLLYFWKVKKTTGKAE